MSTFVLSLFTTNEASFLNFLLTKVVAGVDHQPLTSTKGGLVDHRKHEIAYVHDV